ncbi:MAG: NAAT family transporter [Flavobacteriales bacterium]|nr:NAAT family transporter [Flavobacteriales bacterium]
MSLLSAIVMIILVIDPFGNITFFVSTLKQVDPARHQKVIIRELLIALLFLVVFMVAGKYILQLLGISQSSLTIAGGLLLLLIAIRMIFPAPQSAQTDAVQPTEPFIVPLAVPYVAGPSALATVMLIFNREPDRWPEWLLALFLAWVACSTVILLSPRISKWLGHKGLTAIERLMGMVLTAMAVQMLLSGIMEFMAK